MDKSSSNIWAKLVSLHPDKENINFSIKPNEKNLHQIEDGCKIYQDTLGNTWIKGLKKGSTKVNKAWLGTSKKKMLLGGETIFFYVENAYENQEFEYIFCLINTEPENKLKRQKEASIDQISSTLGELSQKLIKVGDDLEKELTCAICMEILHRSATLTPCQHTFCSSCLFKHLKRSSDCPLCKTQAVFVAKNLVLQNLLSLLSNSFPNLQKPQNDPSKEQIELRGDIVRLVDGVYVGDLVNQKKEGKGVFACNDRRIFDGNWKNDKKDGPGTLRFEDGRIFKGKWSNDLMEPVAEIRFPDRNTYQGEIKNFKMHGKGVFKFAAGDSYDGNWNEGLREGFGKYLWEDGAKYEGNWLKGKRDGQGTMTYSDGNIYNGEWKNSLREGKGILLMKNGNKYEGEFKEDLFYGVGKYLWENGAKYEGNWLKGKIDGNGTMTYSNGDIYNGEWKNGMKEGKGVLKLKNGDTLEGNWVNDALQPKVKIEYLNGDFYEGEINPKNFQKKGKGVLTLKNGNKSDGSWEEDKFINLE